MAERESIELMQLIQDRVKSIKDACEKEMTESDLRKVSTDIDALYENIARLSDIGGKISSKDLQHFYAELANNYKDIKGIPRENSLPLELLPISEPIDRRYDPFGEYEDPFDPKPVEKKVSSADLKRLLDGYLNEVVYSAYEGLNAGKVGDVAAIEYALVNNLSVGPDFVRWYIINHPDPFSYVIKNNIVIDSDLFYELFDRTNGRSAEKMESILRYAFENNIFMDQKIFNAVFSELERPMALEMLGISLKYANGNDLKVDGFHPVGYAIENNLPIHPSAYAWYMDYAITNGIRVNQKTFDKILSEIDKEESTALMESVVQYAVDRNLEIENMDPIEYAMQEKMDIPQRVYDEFRRSPDALHKRMVQYRDRKQQVIDKIPRLISEGKRVAPNIFEDYVREHGVSPKIVEYALKWQFKIEGVSPLYFIEAENEDFDKSIEVIKPLLSQATESFFRENRKKISHYSADELFNLWVAKYLAPIQSKQVTMHGREEVGPNRDIAAYLHILEKNPDLKEIVKNALVEVRDIIKENKMSVAARDRGWKTVANAIDNFVLLVCKLCKGKRIENILVEKVSAIKFSKEASPKISRSLEAERPEDQEISSGKKSRPET